MKYKTAYLTSSSAFPYPQVKLQPPTSTSDDFNPSQLAPHLHSSTRGNMVCEGLAERLKRDYRKTALDNPNRNMFNNLIPPLFYPNHPANLAALQARYRGEHPPYEPACHRRARNEGRREGFAYARDQMG